MNPYLYSTKQFITKHGQNATYIRVTEGSYDIATATTSNSESSTTIRMYKRHRVANQYNYPSLIGKDIAEFYITADTLTGLPAVRDKITDSVGTYTIDSFKVHSAMQENVLYIVLAVKA